VAASALLALLEIMIAPAGQPLGPREWADRQAYLSSPEVEASRSR
jgi:hypothetical protein